MWVDGGFEKHKSVIIEDILSDSFTKKSPKEGPTSSNKEVKPLVIYTLFKATYIEMSSDLKTEAAVEKQLVTC